jgi:hypothetical protein
MAEFTGRDLHLVKKALAIAALAIEGQPGPFQSVSDLSDMNALLDEIMSMIRNWRMTRARRGSP